MTDHRDWTTARQERGGGLVTGVPGIEQRIDEFDPLVPDQPFYPANGVGVDVPEVEGGYTGKVLSDCGEVLIMRVARARTRAGGQLPGMRLAAPDAGRGYPK